MFPSLPGPGPVATGPGPAERARSALHGAPVLEIHGPGVSWHAVSHGYDRDGRPLLLAEDVSPLAALVAAASGPVAVAVHAARIRPLRVADRVRCRVELRGRLDVVPFGEHSLALLELARQGRAPAASALPEGSSLLRVQPIMIIVDGIGVDPRDYRDCEPDPLIDDELRLLHELAGRPHDVTALCTMLDPALLTDAVEIAPSGLDRYGITLRVAGHDHVRETRLPFPEPLDGPREVAGAIQVLLGRARYRSRPATP